MICLWLSNSPLFDDKMESIYTAWRIAIRRVWGLPRRTHCALLPYIADCDIKLMLAKRFISFIEKALKCPNFKVQTITKMGVFGSYSVIGGNYRLLLSRFNMNVKNITNEWNNSERRNTVIVKIK